MMYIAVVNFLPPVSLIVEVSKVLGSVRYVGNFLLWRMHGKTKYLRRYPLRKWVTNQQTTLLQLGAGYAWSGQFFSRKL